jgi:hypothetical protein
MGEVNLRILVFFWNADGLRLCKNLDSTNPRGGFRDYFQEPCTTAKFFPEISELIKFNKPNIVVIGTAEEASSGTYLHSDLLSERMPEMGFVKVDTAKQDGVGDGAIRLSVYTNVPEYIQEYRLSMNGYICENQALGRYSGAACIQINDNRIGNISFVLVDLPDAYDRIKTVREDPNNILMYRSSIKAANKVCLINIINMFAPISQVDHTIMFGDFNYELYPLNTNIKDFVAKLGRDMNSSEFNKLHQYDELRNEIKDVPLNRFKEGLNNSGPEFLPTWKMNKNRSSACRVKKGQTSLPVPGSDCFSTDETHYSFPSWRDRILYSNSGRSKFEIKCGGYNRLDLDGMEQSTHAGVLGIFDIGGRV